ncbi:hypothetical protein F4781DRAFT_141554 [Annulohypoxylon bovei var. microspora]|nr:hypothetical protein F4781DRAFT_141554 [Annulohypoxylon bovei var. microspora]
MRPSNVLRKAVGRLDGFIFESIKELCGAPDSILRPFVKFDMDDMDITSEEARDHIIDRVNLAFLFYIRAEDVYRRLRGDKAFYYLILANWNSEHSAAPFSPARIEQLMNLFITARRRYLAEHPSPSPKADRVTAKLGNLVSVVDRAIAIIDEIDSTVATRKTLSLKPPIGRKADRIWPPSQFGPLDVAIMAETETRKALFGVDNNHPLYEEDIPLYPNDQDLPLTVRKFLCWLSLVETNPNSKTSLFLAPIAFITHEKRQEWYKPTGHKSRFYAIVDEFIEYAHNEFEKTGNGVKNNVMGLLTPWFFEKDEIVADAAEKDRPIPISWQKACFRMGMMLSITKVKKGGKVLGYRVVVFKPGPPYYENIAERPGRREKQGAWVEELLKKLETGFHVQEGWIGGTVRTHLYPNDRKPKPDAVEISGEIIEEVMRDVNTLPSTSHEFLMRGFESLGKYSGF